MATNNSVTLLTGVFMPRTVWDRIEAVSQHAGSPTFLMYPKLFELGVKHCPGDAKLPRLEKEVRTSDYSNYVFKSLHLPIKLYERAEAWGKTRGLGKHEMITRTLIAGIEGAGLKTRAEVDAANLKIHRQQEARIQKKQESQWRGAMGPKLSSKVDAYAKHHQLKFLVASHDLMKLGILNCPAEKALELITAGLDYGQSGFVKRGLEKATERARVKRPPPSVSSPVKDRLAKGPFVDQQLPVPSKKKKGQVS